MSLKSKFGETQITIKHNTKLKLLLHGWANARPKNVFIFRIKDDLYLRSKKFCFKTVHTGISKLVSNNASIEFYESVMDGVREYHVSVLSNVEINNFKVGPPPKGP